MFDMTWLDKGLRQLHQLPDIRQFSSFDMTWLDKGLRHFRYDKGINFVNPLGLIWPDLIRDYDGFLARHCFWAYSFPFDMTWLDKGLRRCWLGREPDAYMRRLIWPDLIRDYDDPKETDAVIQRQSLFDMTWLDKGLRHAFHVLIREKFFFRLIWPDLIRDYDSNRNIVGIPNMGKSVWYDLTKFVDRKSVV